MSKYEIQKLLEEIGFTEKEAVVYIATIELGTNLASVIAKRAKINRCTTYNTLEQLTRRGLITSATRNGVKFYTPEPPSQILKYLTRQRNEIDEQFKQLQEHLIDIEKIQNNTFATPKILLLEGSQRIKQIYKTLNAETLRIGPEELQTELETIINENSVIMISQKEKFGIIIKNGNIANMYRKIFQMINSQKLIPGSQNHSYPKMAAQAILPKA